MCILQFGDTALHWACKDGHLSIVELLLNRGPDAAVQNKVVVVRTSFQDVRCNDFYKHDLEKLSEWMTDVVVAFAFSIIFVLGARALCMMYAFDIDCGWSQNNAMFDC